ncbi:MAG: aldo/keto reductase [Desulfobacterales bacterium]|nr:aldo/keto reductase [Desulfobacterales bacterium]
MDFREQIQLGRTDLKVSRLGLASGYGIEQASIEKAFHEYKVNYFFWSTPRSKKMKAALKHLAVKHRDEMVITAQSYDHSGLLTKHALEKALRTINSDYIDVFILGWFQKYPPGRIIDQALKLRDEGKIKYIAISGHNRKLFGELVKKEDSEIDVIMARYNASHPGAEQDIFPHIKNDNKPGLVAYTATCWGKLMNKRKMPKGVEPLTASDCYRFALSSNHFDVCITGPKNEKQMLEGFEALDKGKLSDEEMERVREVGSFI